MGQGVQAGLRRDAVEAAPGREPLRHGNKFRLGALAAACHDHGLFAPGVRQQLRQPLQAPGYGDAFRPALGQYPGLQAEAGLKHPTVYFLSSIMRTSFPWTITPHFRRDCKTEWGDGYCRGGRLCPSSAVTQRFVGQDPCALPGVWAGQRGEGTPPYTPFTDGISQGAAAAHRRANRFPATVVPVNWGTFSKLPRFAAHLVMRCRVRCEHRAARQTQRVFLLCQGDTSGSSAVVDRI